MLFRHALCLGPFVCTNGPMDWIVEPGLVCSFVPFGLCVCLFECFSFCLQFMRIVQCVYC